MRSFVVSALLLSSWLASSSMAIAEAGSLQDALVAARRVLVLGD